MPVAAVSPQLTNLISAAVAPAALITSCAILLSGYTGKHSSLASQVRGLTAEARQPDTAPERADAIRRQLGLFRRRVSLVWSATVCLSIALLLFLLTVLLVIFVERQARLGVVGAVTLVAGLGCITLAVWLDLSEIVLARRTMAEEFADVLLPHRLTDLANRAGDADRSGE